MPAVKSRGVSPFGLCAVWRRLGILTRPVFLVAGFLFNFYCQPHLEVVPNSKLYPKLGLGKNENKHLPSAILSCFLGLRVNGNVCKHRQMFCESFGNNFIIFIPRGTAGIQFFVVCLEVDQEGWRPKCPTHPNPENHTGKLT